MATIKIYDYSVPERTIEFMNAGEQEVDVMELVVDHEDHPKEYLYFWLSKDEARELITYLRKQFALS